ncbi:class I SAM-dependent methyltransferase [Candidatus Pelagibacter bacterium nBUS_25]|uniref:class I SAM-dependent methyltransferase n=1 Tax=Candidatus Pelagibacter bacterium nBUS_25 TaxID=3374187 RepID=UPI003EBE4B12
MQNFKKISSKKNLKFIINFGNMPLGNGFQNKKKNSKSKEYKFKMKLGFNKLLSLVQLYENPPPNKMFNKNYAFLSSTSNFMKDHFKKYAETIKKIINKKNFSILEVGCNDGILLENFKSQDHLGVEPSKNVCEIAKKKKLNVINKFFNEKLLKTPSLKKKKFDVICGANVFCHIPNLEQLFKTAETLLDKNGIFVIEEPYLGDVVEKISYDQIYDEHIYIFSIHSINKIASFFNLEAFHAERQKTHGGSMRYYLSKKNIRKKSSKLKNLVKLEKKLGLNDYDKLINFKKKCEEFKHNLYKKLSKLSKENNIYGYGATSKSTTILNYCGIDKNFVKGIFDTSKTKIGKLTPGSKIPILDYSTNFKKIKPKLCILFAWNHFKEICEKEKKELKKGLKFLVHIDKKHMKGYQRYFI